MKKINVLNLAAYIRERYAKENNNETIDEVKIHRLLYFAQRETLLRYDTTLFDANFYAWKYGPVLHEIREAYENNSISTTEPVPLTDEQTIVMDYIFNQYSKKSSWSLTRLTRGQISYKYARKGIPEYTQSDELMSLEKIKYDAQCQLERRQALQAAGLL